MFITGLVIGQDREPLAGVELASSPAVKGYKGRTGVDVTSRRDGSFRLGPLSPGFHLVRASGRGRYAGLGPIKLKAPEENVKLQLPVKSALRGTVLAAASAKPTFCEVRILKREDGAWDTAVTDPVTGIFDFGDLQAATYDLAVDDEGWVGRLRGVKVRAGEVQRDLILRVHKGAKLAVKIEGDKQPTKERPYKLSLVRRGALYHTQTITSAEARMPVPAGSCTVVLAAPKPKREWRRAFSVEAGKTADVTFVP